MKQKTTEKILGIIASNGQASLVDLTRALGLSRQAIHRQVNTLIKENRLKKVGKPPKVFYLLADKRSVPEEHPSLPPDLNRVISQNFLIITPTGEWREGLTGFEYWCRKQKLPLEKTAREYQQTIAKYTRYKKNGLIDGKYKLEQTFGAVYLDKIFYLDFYSIERFGKTKLGQLLLYAKQSQDRQLMKNLVDQIRPAINNLRERFKVDAVGFIPPTVKREVQLMRELERELALPVATISLTKVKTPIIIPQKTLTRLEDRIENARKTIVVEERRAYNTILLIDDALGSGATLNEVARKIKEQKLAETVIGLAITGSFSGFEVISEV